jgi:uncharacterized protein YbjT (DUF2867 family)
MILIVGATGLVGSATVRQLTARGVPVRALVRSAEKAETIAGPGVETMVGDLEQPGSLDAALDGVTRALLISPLHPRQVEGQGNFVEAARRAGAVHIVKLSGLGTALDSPLRSGRWHAQTERHIAAAGLPWTYLHPPFFMQNLLRSAAVIAAQGVLVAAMQAGKIAMVDARDVRRRRGRGAHLRRPWRQDVHDHRPGSAVIPGGSAKTCRVYRQTGHLPGCTACCRAAGDGSDRPTGVACGGAHGVCDGPARRLRCGGHGHSPGGHRAASADV